MPRQDRAQLRAQALQKAILSSANFASIATDEQGLIQVFNVGAERLLGYTAAQVIDHLTPADLCDPAELRDRAEAITASSGNAVPTGFEALVFRAACGLEDIYELTLRCQDGTPLPVVLSVTALRDGEGVIIGFLLVGTDNTARKRVEAEQARLDQRLRDQQFYTRSLIEAVADALITTDPSGVISDVNAQTEALTGRTRDELIGTPFKQYFTEPPRAQAFIERVLDEKQVSNFELTAHGFGRGDTVVSCNATPFYDRDRMVRGVIAAMRDVTERRLLDRALEETNLELQAAKVIAEDANEAKSEFLSSMSHELRSPLNAILGFAQLLEGGSPPPTPVQRDSIDQILQAGWYLLELINQVLDLARIESGKLSLSPEALALAEVLEDCQAMIEPEAHRRGIALRFVPPEQPVFVRADRTRAKQIFVNLLSNAIKYNRPGGSVEVRWERGDGDRVRIRFQDTGEGLSPAKQAQLFQSFNRLGQESGTEEGTGIGLVVCRQLVALMGGEIGVDSKVGVGSVFWVELDAVAAPDAADGGLLVGPLSAAGTRCVEPPVVQRTVLCIEDNAANLLLVTRLLERRPDIRLLTARDGQHGVEIARAALPEVVLTDIDLPGMSGLTALKMLAGDAATAHIPVIALSANAMPRDIEKGLAAGFFRYLTKPVRVTELMDAIDLALAMTPVSRSAPAPKSETAPEPEPEPEPEPLAGQAH